MAQACCGRRDWGAAQVRLRAGCFGEEYLVQLKKDLYIEKSPSHRQGTLSAFRAGSGSGWAPTTGLVTLERLPAPLRDPVRKETGSRE